MIAEFKIQEGTDKWEDTPVEYEEPYTDRDAAQSEAQRYANFVNREVRWNWKGQLQGHYAEPRP